MASLLQGFLRFALRSEYSAFSKPSSSFLPHGAAAGGDKEDLLLAADLTIEKLAKGEVEQTENLERWNLRPDSVLAGVQLDTKTSVDVGYTSEDKRFILGPSVETGNQPLG